MRSTGLQKPSYCYNVELTFGRRTINQPPLWYEQPVQLVATGPVCRVTRWQPCTQLVLRSSLLISSVHTGLFFVSNIRTYNICSGKLGALGFFIQNILGVKLPKMNAACKN